MARQKDAERESKAQVAERLAQAHATIEPSIGRIFRLESDRERLDDEPIKLLEVTDQTIEAGIVPVHFGPGPSKGIPYRSAIIEVTPEEFARVERGGLALPDGCRLASECAIRMTVSVR